MRGNLFQIDGLLRKLLPQACLVEQGYRKGKPSNVPSMIVMSGLVGGRYLTHFIALVVLGLLDRGDQLIINCLLRVAFQMPAQESSVQRADSVYPLGHGWVACFPRRVGCCPKARDWGPAGTLTAPLRGPAPLEPPSPWSPRGRARGPRPSLLLRGVCQATLGRGPLSSVLSLWAFPVASVLAFCPYRRFLPKCSFWPGGKSPKWHTRVGSFGRGGSWEATLAMGCLFFAFIAFPTKLPEMSFSCRIQRQLQGIRKTCSPDQSWLVLPPLPPKDKRLSSPRPLTQLAALPLRQPQAPTPITSDPSRAPRSPGDTSRWQI